MRRREFTGLLGGAAMAWPAAAVAQQPTIGYLDPRSPGTAPSFVSGWRVGLREAGYVEGQNLAVEYRWTEGQPDNMKAMAADLARRPLAAIIAAGNLAAATVKAATSTIPIVFIVSVDPVAFGLVDGLNRSAGNATGVTTFSSELVAKRLELLREMVPGAAVAAALTNPNNPNTKSDTRHVEAAARALAMQIHVLSASGDRDLDVAFATAKDRLVAAMSVHSDQFFDTRRHRIAALAERYGIPTIFNNREFVVAGGLMSYGENRSDTYRLAGGYAGRVLRGEKPSDLPVLQPTNFELALNLKTAKALGVTVPQSILIRADEVIE